VTASVQGIRATCCLGLRDANQAASNPLPQFGPVKAGSVAFGYLGDPETTATTFVDGWLHTDDLGYQDPDGYLFLTGRIKELINRGGEKFSPQQIDAVLLSNTKVADTLSFGVPDEKYGEEINAAVILKNGEQTDERELGAYCGGRHLRADLRLGDRGALVAALVHIRRLGGPGPASPQHADPLADAGDRDAGHPALQRRPSDEHADRSDPIATPESQYRSRFG
jgi:AMP-binding enzyme/AMP-binding enzyme C-terminal domain